MSQILHEGILMLKILFLIYLKFKFNWCHVLLFGKSGNPLRAWVGVGVWRQVGGALDPARSCGMILQGRQGPIDPTVWFSGTE